jgi:hypothetical protein
MEYNPDGNPYNSGLIIGQTKKCPIDAAFSLQSV